MARGTEAPIRPSRGRVSNILKRASPKPARHRAAYGEAIGDLPLEQADIENNPDWLFEPKYGGFRAG